MRFHRHGVCSLNSAISLRLLPNIYRFLTCTTTRHKFRFRRTVTWGSLYIAYRGAIAEIRSDILRHASAQIGGQYGTCCITDPINLYFRAFRPTAVTAINFLHSIIFSIFWNSRETLYRYYITPIFDRCAHSWGVATYPKSLRWRHNGRDSVSNHHLTIVDSTVIQTQIKENIKAPRHWPLCGEFTGDRWIPRTNGQ